MARSCSGSTLLEYCGVMAHQFTMRRRVEFAETDMAGIMHFANFFRFMEMTEHAFYRSLGFSVDAIFGKARIGWPRVRAECEFKTPLRFEDEVEIELRVAEKRRRSLRYEFVFRKGEDEVARGAMTVVCVSFDPATNAMKAVEIPAELARLITVAPRATELM